MFPPSLALLFAEINEIWSLHHKKTRRIMPAINTQLHRIVTSGRPPARFVVASRYPETLPPASNTSTLCCQPLGESCAFMGLASLTHPAISMRTYIWIRHVLARILWTQVTVPVTLSPKDLHPTLPNEGWTRGWISDCLWCTCTTSSVPSVDRQGRRSMSPSPAKIGAGKL